MSWKSSKEDKPKAEPKAKPDPVGEAQEPEKVEVVDVAKDEPYPTGSPPDPAEEFKKIHGFDKPS